MPISARRVETPLRTLPQVHSDATLPPARAPFLDWASRAWRLLASLKLTLALLSLLMILVVVCTLAQVQLGTFGAVNRTIRAFWVYGTPLGLSRPIPIFPGGGALGALLLLNLVAAQAGRLQLSWRKAGMWAVHFGLVVLFGGEFVTSFLQTEAQLSVVEGESRAWAERVREVELAVMDSTDPGSDEVVAFSEPLVRRSAALEHERLPFTVLVKRLYPNSTLSRRMPGEKTMPSIATQGVGTDLIVFPRLPVSRDDEADQVSAFIEVVDGDRSLGTWLVSTGIPEPQAFRYMDKEWRLALRPRRDYLPFTLTLKDFTRELYPGTETPKRFSSLVRLEDHRTGEDREVLISMNQPLRHDGWTFYQASFGREDTLSVLQVVRNPGWLMPYLACALVAAGLLWHFLARLAPARAAS